MQEYIITLGQMVHDQVKFIIAESLMSKGVVSDFKMH